MIWVDMDGVLADFDLGYRERFGRDPKLDQDEVKWPLVNGVGDFFAKLPPTHYAEELWAAVVRLEPQARVLMALSKSIPQCLRQKIEWLLYNGGIRPDHVTAVTGKRNKYLFCTPGDLLIDDTESNCMDWTAAGGKAILHDVNDWPRTRGLLAAWGATRG